MGPVIGDFDRRRNVIAVATAVMMGIPLVAIETDLVRITRHMA